LEPSKTLDYTVRIFGDLCRLFNLLWPLILIFFVLLALVSSLVDCAIVSLFILLAAPCTVLLWVSRTGPRFRRSFKEAPPALLVGLYMVSTYVLLVMVFACAFIAAETFGGRIVCTSNGVPIDRKQIWDYFYFSVVSGSTLGYGELTPQGWTRLFVGLQVIMFWLFIVVASIKMSVLSTVGEK